NNSNYKCVVRNAAGQAVSSSATLLVTVSIVKTGTVNGFSASTHGSFLSIHLPAGISTAQISVIDIWGRTVWNRKTENGVQNVTWNGTGANGKPIASGIYVLRANLLSR